MPTSRPKGRGTADSQLAEGLLSKRRADTQLQFQHSIPVLSLILERHRQEEQTLKASSAHSDGGQPGLNETLLKCKDIPKALGDKETLGPRKVLVVQALAASACTG